MILGASQLLKESSMRERERERREIKRERGVKTNKYLLYFLMKKITRPNLFTLHGQVRWGGVSPVGPSKLTFSLKKYKKKQKGKKY